MEAPNFADWGLLALLKYICTLCALWIGLLLLFKYVIRPLVRKFTEPFQQSVDVDLNGVHYPVSYWTEKGGRPYQEDRHDAVKGTGSADCSLYGVFDGHGGFKASQYCCDNMLKSILADCMFLSNPQEALKKSFHRVDTEFISICKKNHFTDGTTAVVAVISNKNITVANAGDSRCIVVQKGGRAYAMSIDHKPSREDEEQRIRELGGKVIFWGRWRVEGVLAVSRAIGDITLKPYVTCDPEVETKMISDEDMYLVLASDGLWDVMSNEEVASFVVKDCQHQDFKYIARDLCYEATLLGSTDNITVQVVDLRYNFEV